VIGKGGGVAGFWTSVPRVAGMASPMSLFVHRMLLAGFKTSCWYLCGGAFSILTFSRALPA